MRKFFGVLAVFAMLVVSGCGHSGSNEQKIADDVTQAVYNNDASAVQQNFTSDLAATVTRTSVGDLSDKMHQLGAYQGLTETGSDLPAKRYIFDAKFDKGDMTVRIRLDPSGKIAAYRLTPGAPQ